MGRPVTDPTLTRCEFKLGKTTLAALDAIATESARRTGKPPSRADAVRWAAQELRARIELARMAAAGPGATFTPPGPFTEPPKV